MNERESFTLISIKGAAERACQLYLDNMPCPEFYIRNDEELERKNAIAHYVHEGKYVEISSKYANSSTIVDKLINTVIHELIHAWVHWKGYPHELGGHGKWFLWKAKEIEIDISSTLVAFPEIVPTWEAIQNGWIPQEEVKNNVVQIPVKKVVYKDRIIYKDKIVYQDRIIEKKKDETTDLENAIFLFNLFGTPTIMITVPILLPAFNIVTPIFAWQLFFGIGSFWAFCWSFQSLYLHLTTKSQDLTEGIFMTLGFSLFAFACLYLALTPDQIMKDSNPKTPEKITRYTITEKYSKNGCKSCGRLDVLINYPNEVLKLYDDCIEKNKNNKDIVCGVDVRQ